MYLTPISHFRDFREQFIKEAQGLAKNKLGRFAMQSDNFYLQTPVWHHTTHSPTLAWQASPNCPTSSLHKKYSCFAPKKICRILCFEQVGLNLSHKSPLSSDKKFFGCVVIWTRGCRVRSAKASSVLQSCYPNFQSSLLQVDNFRKIHIPRKYYSPNVFRMIIHWKYMLCRFTERIS